MSQDGQAPGATGLHLVGGLALLRPEEQVLSAMLDGWRNQQLARNLAFSTISGRERVVQVFVRHAEAFPWHWSAQMVDEWSSDLRAVRHLKRSTLRHYQEAVRSFCAYIIDPAYGWAAQCEQRFGTYPVQVCHEWNTAVHVAEAEADAGKRAFTRDELQAFFDHADDQVANVRGLARKGWLPAFRDAALFKTAYAFGLRRNEARMLDVVDFGRNPKGAEFGEYGVAYVRHGKAMKGSPPKRRSVLTIWPWSAEILQQWLEEVRPLFPTASAGACWPSERGPRIGFSQMNTRFAAYRDAIGLDAGLDFHSFRRSHITHQVEDGFDARFVQEQAGHEHASTTSIYTCVSSDFRTRTLRRVLDSTVEAALGHAEEGAMKRQTSYQWRLREVMATHAMFTATDLEPHLADRGINLSSVQVWRVVTQTPERLSLPLLAALCDIFGCTPADLIATRADNAAPRRAASAGANVTDMAASVRPKRARVRPDP